MYLYLVAEISEYLTYKEVCIIERLAPFYGYDINYSNGVIWTYFNTDVKTIKKIKQCTKKRLAMNLYSLQVPRKGCVNAIHWGYGDDYDISSFMHLKTLTYVSLTSLIISDITPLAQLTTLLCVSLSFTRVADITPLANLTSLKLLFLDNTPVQDIAPLRNINTLEAVFLGSTPIKDLTPLANKPLLRILDLSHTQIVDLTPIAGLPLERLLICGSWINDVSMIDSTCQIFVD